MGRSDPVGWVSLLPPSPSGIATYSSLLLPLLQRSTAVRAFDPTGLDTLRRRLDRMGRIVYNIGNHVANRAIVDLALEHPDILVIHDLAMFHALPPDERVERWKDAGVWMDRAQDLLPWGQDLMERQKMIVVHSEEIRDRLAMMGITTSITVVPLPVPPIPATFPTPGGTPSVGIFGFMGSNRQIATVESICADLHLPLYLVGTPPDNFKPRWEGTVVTGWVPAAEWGRYLARVHVVINLRYPWMGEVSLTTLEAMGSGRPVLLFDMGSYALLPDEAVVKISPVLPVEERVRDALRALIASPKKCEEMGEAGRAWVARHHQPSTSAARYLEILRPEVSRDGGDA